MICTFCVQSVVHLHTPLSRHVQAGYGDNFCDAMGELYDLFTAQGATVVGATSTDGYDHTDSKSIRDGKFVGMPFDEVRPHTPPL